MSVVGEACTQCPPKHKVIDDHVSFVAPSAGIPVVMKTASSNCRNKSRKLQVISIRWEGVFLAVEEYMQEY